ncbi:hypothetical protein C8R46DRAFT_910945, partial [Mycena filopes]
NKTELKRLIGRIEHVVQALEDSKARDVIREDEYNDGLNTISDLIRRSEKLGQRMLKRSLGDRTWNAGEIAAEIKAMNEDVQTYLSVHSVSLLHWLSRAQLEQYNFLATSVQDVVVKVFLLTFIPFASSGISFSCLGRSIQTIAESNIAAVTEEVATQVASSKLRPLTAGDTDVTRLVKSAQGDVRIFGLKRASNPLKQDGKITLQGLSNIPDWNNISERLESAGGFIMLATLGNSGFVPPDLVKELNALRVKIVDGDSTFNASSPEGLRISQFIRNSALLWSRYQDYHGMRDKKWDRRPYGDTFPVPYTPGYTRAELVDDGKAILVAGVKFEFHRTFRIPDSADEITQSLPPSLGQFPMVAVSDFTARLPDKIRERGGFLIPMFNREALSINFCKQESEKAAVKVSVGGVNAVSGEVKNKMSPPGVNQDYIVSNQQPWLDGVRTSAGVVRQFVVAQLGEGYTVEEQITGTATEGGFQFDSKPDSQMCGSVLDGYPVFPELPEALFKDIRLKQGRKSTATLPHQHDSWDFQDYRRRNNNDCLLRALYEDDYSSDWDTGAQPLAFCSRRQNVGTTISSSILLIPFRTQKIFKDADQPSIYDENQGQRFHVHIVSPEQWEEITGILAPITPITTELYAQFNLPWFSLYENFQEDISHVSEALASLKSVSAWDEINTPSDSALVDPDHPGDCSIHTGQITTCVFRPCGHAGCSGCLGAAMLNGSKCTTCNAHIERFVGTTQPVPVKVSQSSDGDAREWSVSVIESLARQTRDRATVEIIQFDPRDRVSPLFRSGSQVVGLSAPVSTTQKRRGKTLWRKLVA